MDIITRTINEYYEFRDETEPKSFETFLMEVNSGSMEKDIRISDITETIKSDMISCVKKEILEGQVDAMVVPKSKNPVGKYYTIGWQFDVVKSKSPKWFTNGAWLDKSKKLQNVVAIGIGIHKDTEKTDDEFTEQLVEFITSGNINQHLRHEVRHFIDLVDNKFQNDNYHDIEDVNTATELHKIKYMSQHREIELQLISVLSDLEYLYKNHNRTGDTYTIEKAMQDSKAYQGFMKYLIPSKRSKYRVKIIHFWFEKFERRTR